MPSLIPAPTQSCRDRPAEPARAATKTAKPLASPTAALGDDHVDPVTALAFTGNSNYQVNRPGQTLETVKHHLKPNR